MSLLLGILAIGLIPNTINIRRIICMLLKGYFRKGYTYNVKHYNSDNRDNYRNDESAVSASDDSYLENTNNT